MLLFEKINGDLLMVDRTVSHEAPQSQKQMLAVCLYEYATAIIRHRCE